MRNFIVFTLPLVAALLTSCASSPEKSNSLNDPPVVYHRLALLDLDEVVAMVQGKVAESRTSGDRFTPLREGVFAVYARPDDDGMIDKVLPPLRNEADENDAWETIMSDATQEAINALKTPESLSPAGQVTYIVYLQNIVADLKPQARKAGTFERDLLIRIRDAKIQITPEARDERQIRLMKQSANPSELAQKVVGEAAKK